MAHDGVTWYKVSSAPPKKTGMYLVTDGHAVGVGWWDIHAQDFSKCTTSIPADYSPEMVVHWAYLPTPPKRIR